MISWNILSGKVINKFKLETSDFNEYRVFHDYSTSDTDEVFYKLGISNKTLLIKNEPEEDMKDELFFEPYQIKNTTIN